MRCFASLVVCATLSQVLWIGLSGGQDIDCTKVDHKSECCSDQNTCVYVNCTVKSKAVAACYNSTNGTSCDDPVEAVNSCGSDVTTPKPEAEITQAPTPEEKVDCSTYTNRKECCAAENSTACVFYQCTDEDDNVDSKECIAAGATPSCTDDYTAKNACKTDETPEGEGEKTPEGEGEKTPEVDCAASSSDENACCTAGNSTACSFFRCTSADGNVTGTLCVAAASTPACPDKTDTPSTNICEQSGGPTTAGPDNQNATKSPTAGEEAGGQQFDAASFIGGIVLCAGILAIAYFGLKFYRSRQERNYESM